MRFWKHKNIFISNALQRIYYPVILWNSFLQKFLPDHFCFMRSSKNLGITLSVLNWEALLTLKVVRQRQIVKFVDLVIQLNWRPGISNMLYEYFRVSIHKSKIIQTWIVTKVRSLKTCFWHLLETKPLESPFLAPCRMSGFVTRRSNKVIEAGYYSPL